MTWDYGAAEGGLFVIVVVALLVGALWRRWRP